MRFLSYEVITHILGDSAVGGTQLGPFLEGIN